MARKFSKKSLKRNSKKRLSRKTKSKKQPCKKGGGYLESRMDKHLKFATGWEKAPQDFKLRVPVWSSMKGGDGNMGRTVMDEKFFGQTSKGYSSPLTSPTKPSNVSGFSGSSNPTNVGNAFKYQNIPRFSKSMFGGSKKKSKTSKKPCKSKK